MARPVKKRTGRSYARDVETLVRLQSAIQLDDTIEEGVKDDLTGQISAIVKSLSKLIREERATA